MVVINYVNQVEGTTDREGKAVCLYASTIVFKEIRTLQGPSARRAQIHLNNKKKNTINAFKIYPINAKKAFLTSALKSSKFPTSRHGRFSVWHPVPIK
jgi:hypothetical protein